MKVALVTNRFPSISETFVYNHAAGLQAAGIDVTVIAMRPSLDAAAFARGEGPRFAGTVVLPILATEISTTVRRFVAELARRPREDLAVWRAAAGQYGTTVRAIRAWSLAVSCRGFDVVHFELSGLAVSWRDTFPLLRPAKLVVSCRGSAEQVTPLSDPRRAGQLREIFANVNRVHCVSARMRSACERYGLDPAKAFVNHPAVDTARFRREIPYRTMSPGPLRLLSTGRLHWTKGLEFGLLAVRALVERGVAVHYTIIGGGPEEPRLRFDVHELGIESHVTFAGSQPTAEVRRALADTDVFVLPSVSEGVSNAALEAMAMGVPVVSTNAGGMTEAITDGVNGVIVPMRDPTALAARIAELATDGKRRGLLGAAARERVESAFNLERQIRSFIAEYAALA